MKAPFCWRAPPVNERQFIKPPDLPAHAQAIVEIDQVRAATKQDVLAVIHHSRCLGVRKKTPALRRKGALEDSDPQSGFGQRAATARPASPPPTIATLCCRVSAVMRCGVEIREIVLSIFPRESAVHAP